MKKPQGKNAAKSLAQMAMVVVSLVLTDGASAHEGHDHDAPVTIAPPKGGTLKSLEKTSVEVVNKGKDLKIYLYDTQLKPIPVAGFIVAAKAEMPRTKKQEEIQLVPKENSFEASFDAKGLHRYTLLLSVKDPKTGHDDKLTFVIEPKK